MSVSLYKNGENSEVIVKLPVKVLAEIVSCADGLADAVQRLENLNSEWAVVERVHEVDAVTSLHTLRFDSKELLTEHLEKSHIDPNVEVVAVLKHGVPRNMKVTVHVQFR